MEEFEKFNKLREEFYKYCKNKGYTNLEHKGCRLDCINYQKIQNKDKTFANEFANDPSLADLYCDMVQKTFNRKHLYQFTSFESACKIILSQKLLFGKLANMNDISEAHKRPTRHLDMNIIFGGIYRLIQTLNKQIEEDKKVYDFYKQIRQLSLSYDKKKSPVFFKLPMWGFYAKNGTGVCLVFDEKKIKEKVKSLKQKEVVLHSGAVFYNQKGVLGLDVNLDYENLSKHQITRIFFRKTKEWRFEQEYRILAKATDDESVSLDIKDCLQAIILFDSQGTGNIQNNAEFIALEKLTDYKIPLLEFRLAQEDIDNESKANAKITLPVGNTTSGNSYAYQIFPEIKYRT